MHHPFLVAKFAFFVCWKKYKLLWNQPWCVICVIKKKKLQPIVGFFPSLVLLFWQLNICQHCNKHFKCTTFFNLGCLKKPGLFQRFVQRPFWRPLPLICWILLILPSWALHLIHLCPFPCIFIYSFLFLWIMVQTCWNVTWI